MGDYDFCIVVYIVNDNFDLYIIVGTTRFMIGFYGYMLVCEFVFWVFLVGEFLVFCVGLDEGEVSSGELK